MKAVILAGGYGTRIAEESALRPKPMVEIGGRPILWHIMKMYLAHGVDEFIICCGYKSSVIKQYFANYALTESDDLLIDMRTNRTTLDGTSREPWSVRLVETGERSMTGGRLRRVREHLGDESFHFTYGDCVSDVDLTALLAFHRSQGVRATLTAVQPPGRFGVLTLAEGETRIREFTEKPSGDGGWINGGFFVLEPSVIDYIDGDDTVWERGPMDRLSHEGMLAAYRHSGYWQNMDTVRDRMVLEEQWASGSPPWRVW